VTPPEEALQFRSGELNLPGILHRPADGAGTRVGVVIVVGGPQYRVGSHRQFVLLARDLAAAGYPVLRFDYRGMGDADGEPVGFEGAGPDIEAAVDTLMAQCPTLDGVVLWGLCDAASAALFQAPRDGRIVGLVLLNPWVRTEAGAARTTLRHYYRGRFTDLRVWRRLLKEPARLVRAAGSLVALRRAASSQSGSGDGGRMLPERMLAAAEAYAGNLLWILSGRDLTADEFREVVSADARWEALLARDGSRCMTLEAANHTFSSASQREEVARLTREWLDETEIR